MMMIGQAAAVVVVTVAAKSQMVRCLAAGKMMIKSEGRCQMDC